jgi:hypothetical protein
MFVPSQFNTATQVKGTQPTASAQLTDAQKNKLADSTQLNTCYTLRTYRFTRQDGQAPVPAGEITCTPANTLQQRSVFHAPNSLFVPLNLSSDHKTSGAQTSEQKSK